MIELKHTKEMGEIRDRVEQVQHRLDRVEKLLDKILDGYRYPTSSPPPETHQ